ncbi:hypothetical protein RFI_01632 [Reticulomyxa filosa]|uniref:PH domain-containing protein n=1 Tax=Reticulomyxa filosa TaxID=46433 RepID=X6PCQ1_RETFI|nr:hypothetical protein RFI_01632 [Reticulomyxa filosa]|eukprot:ETO35432.1 hypothetical protein RFI_01632 [Reticulomyxa filosa]
MLAKSTNPLVQHVSQIGVGERILKKKCLMTLTIKKKKKTRKIKKQEKISVLIIGTFDLFRIFECMCVRIHEEKLPKLSRMRKRRRTKRKKNQKKKTDQKKKPKKSSKEESESGSIVLLKYTGRRRRRKRKPQDRIAKVTFGENASTKQISWGSGSRHIDFDEILYIAWGHWTPVFQSGKDQLDPTLCFSVVGKTQTLDVQAQSKEMAELWVKELRIIDWTTDIDQSVRDKFNAKLLYEEVLVTVQQSTYFQDQFVQPMNFVCLCLLFKSILFVRAMLFVCLYLYFYLYIGLITRFRFYFFIDLLV